MAAIVLQNGRAGETIQMTSRGETTTQVLAPDYAPLIAPAIGEEPSFILGDLGEDGTVVLDLRKEKAVAMSNTYELICTECRVSLWVAQGWVRPGDSLETIHAKGRLYSTADHLVALRDFLFCHMGHALQFVDSQEVPDDIAKKGFDDDDDEEGEGQRSAPEDPYIQRTIDVVELLREMEAGKIDPIARQQRIARGYTIEDQL